MKVSALMEARSSRPPPLNISTRTCSSDLLSSLHRAPPSLCSSAPESGSVGLEPSPQEIRNAQTASPTTPLLIV